MIYCFSLYLYTFPDTLAHWFLEVCFTAIKTMSAYFFTNFVVYTKSTYAAAIFVVKPINTL